MCYFIKDKGNSNMTHSSKKTIAMLRQLDRFHQESGACHWNDYRERLRSEVNAGDHGTSPTFWRRDLAEKKNTRRYEICWNPQGKHAVEDHMTFLHTHSNINEAPYEE